MLINFLKVWLVPLLITFAGGYFLWRYTKDTVELTFKLDSWITVGSVKQDEIPNLKLMLDSQQVGNILKVSWKIINTGTRGISNFETNPFINYPSGLKVISARVSEKSELLK